MTENKPISLFVYGSLSEGFVHYDKIKDFIVQKQDAQAAGSAYRLKVGFPVYLESGADFVPGSLLTLNGSGILMNILDEFHGVSFDEPQKSLYFRKEMSVQTQQGDLKAWAYVLNPEKLPKDAQRIENGDWKRSLEEEPPLPAKLTERQKVYVRKLGAVTGREIVPINDLSLYRELMNLELIVDKGRRLALSKLGHEVNRYLE